MKFRYPNPTLPRANALTDLILSPALTPERIDPALRRVLSSRLVALAPPRHLGSVRLDSYAVEQARSTTPRAQTSFSWSPQFSRRILGVAAAQRVLSGYNTTPSSAVRAEIDNIVSRCQESPTRPGSLGAWLAKAPFGVVGAVIGEAVTYATEVITALDWDRLGADASVGRADPVWAVPGAPWVALRGRRDATIALNGSERTRALFVVRSGRPTRTSHGDLAHVALVEGLTNPERPLPTRIVGLWPACGKAMSLEVTKEVAQHAARSLVDGMAALRRKAAQPQAA